jgi:anaerobic magnesium-protoporphyrin IX monomethyl ester cyclase
VKKVLLLGFKKTYSVFSLARHAILEVTNSIQLNTLLGFCRSQKQDYHIQALEVFYTWPDRILDLTRIEKSINEINPDIIAVSLMNADTGVFEILRNQINRNSGKNITWIGGGYFPTSMPDAALNSEWFDYIVRSHGEVALHSLLQYLSTGNPSLAQIPNLSYVSNGSQVHNEISISAEQEEKVKLIYEPFNRDAYLKEAWQIPPISEMKYLTTWYSRGCKYNCSFCLNQTMNHGKILRRDPELVIDEIFEMHHLHGINYVFFADENFLRNMGSEFVFLKKMRSRNFRSKARYTFMTDVRTMAAATEELLGLLKETGCEEIQFGVESGSKLMLDRMNKKSSNELVFQAFEKTNSAGIMAQAMMVLGHEGETIDTLKETRDFIRKLKPDRVSYFFSVPFPGTQLHIDAIGQPSQIPFFMYDSDFPVFPVRSLEEDIKSRGIRVANNLDPVIVREFSRFGFSFSPSQLYLMNFRDELMYQYYISNEFFKQQAAMFKSRVNIFDEDPELLLRSAEEWFAVLEKSVGYRDYKNAMMSNLMQKLKSK